MAARSTSGSSQICGYTRPLKRTVNRRSSRPSVERVLLRWTAFLSRERLGRSSCFAVSVIIMAALGIIQFIIVAYFRSMTFRSRRTARNRSSNLHVTHIKAVNALLAMRDDGNGIKRLNQIPIDLHFRRPSRDAPSTNRHSALFYERERELPAA